MGLVANVKAINLLQNKQIQLTWDAYAGATSYKVYRRAVPYGTFTFVAAVSAPTLTYTDAPILIPLNEWFFKVAAVTSGGEQALPDLGITCENANAFIEDPFTQTGFPMYPENGQMSFIFEEIRRRHIWGVQLNGEDMVLYKKRYEGTKCPHVGSEDDQCPFPLGNEELATKCYGTGYVGGYYGPLTIKVRRYSVPQKVSIEEQGYDISVAPKFWTIWTPRIESGDFLVTQENKRFEVTDVTPSTTRGLMTKQDISVVLKKPTDIIYKV